ncbi:MAG: tetratricopeptide repeat protein [Fimbriimonas sp.]
MAVGQHEFAQGNHKAAYRAFLNSGTPEGEVNAGICAAILGNHELARTHFEAAHQRNPRDPHIRRFLGMAHSEEGGDPARAIELLKGEFDAEAMFCRANAAMKLGLHDQAATDFRRVTKVQPNKAAAWANLGLALERIGKPGAEDAFRRAVASDPQLLAANWNLADLLRNSGRPTESLSFYEAALRTAPDVAGLHLDYGQALQLAKRADDAVRAYTKTIELAPKQPAARLNRAQVWAEMGDLARADADIAEAVTLGVGWAAWRQKLLMPPIASSHAEISQRRAELEAFLDQPERPALNDPAAQILAPGFFLAYHGANNRTLATKIATRLAEACPNLRFTHVRAEASRTRRKILFASAHFRDHTVGHITEGLIRGMNRDQFEVVVVRPNGATDEVTARIDAAADSVVVVSPRVSEARREIAALAADVIYYPDIGMEPWSYYLGFCRLAPFQCVGWGHADTTGLPELDAYLTCNSFDPEGAEDFYSERLLRSERILASMTPTSQLSAPLHAESGTGVRRYICPQSLFKIHPDFDSAIAELLRIDPSCRIVFPEPPYPSWREALVARLGDLAASVDFVPRVSAAEFVPWLATFDAILDPIHFTGGYSTFQALAAGLPIVTWAGSHLPGRMTAGFYQQMGIQGLVASDSAEFAEIAVRVGADPSSHRREVFERSEAIVEDPEGVREFERLIVEGLTS